MSERNFKKIVLFNNVTPVAVTSSTDATPIVVTATAHGFTTGQRVMIVGHTTNIAANGTYQITVASANTFSLQDLNTGANIAGSGAGAGSGGVVVAAPPLVLAKDWRNAVLQFFTSGTATMTVKMAVSLGKAISVNDDTAPNFGAAASATNPYTYCQLLNLNAQETVAGATGLVVAGTDFAATYELNFNAVNYFTPIIVSWSAGAVTAMLLVTDNK